MFGNRQPIPSFALSVLDAITYLEAELVIRDWVAGWLSRFLHVAAEVERVMESRYQWVA